MSRRRYISTTISIDKRVALLSDSAALLWTWMIPHAEDDATLPSDPDEVRWIVIPSRPDMDVAACLNEIAGQRLIVRKDGTLYFDTEAFYRYQSNVPLDKRADHSAIFTEEQRESAKNSEEQQESAENSASLSLSLSLSPSLKRSRSLVDASAPTGANNDDFTEWWTAYGKIGSKADAERLYQFWRGKGAERADLLTAAVTYRAHCERTDCKMQHARTFLAKPQKGARARWYEWAEGEEHGSMDVAGDDELASVLRAGALTYGSDNGGHPAVCESDQPTRLAGRREDDRIGIPAQCVEQGDRGRVRDGAHG
jgi:hypothetical protein